MPQQTKLDTLSPGQRGKLVMIIQAALAALKQCEVQLGQAQQLMEVEITVDDMKTLATEIEEPLEAWALTNQQILDHLELLYEKER